MLFLIVLSCLTMLVNSQKQISSNQVVQIDQFNEEPYSNQPEKCVDARLKCAFRIDCGQALNYYMRHCTNLVAGHQAKCPKQCTNALIALASTEQGSKLINCDCGNSKFCLLNKERIEVCRAEVEHQIAEDTIVNCSTAKLICSSDNQCLTALFYYNKHCKAMFKGKICTKRCLNSLNILNRQSKANKLRTCVCDGTENFPCTQIRQNTETLCLKKYNLSQTLNLFEPDNIETSFKKIRPSLHHLKHKHHHKQSYENENQDLIENNNLQIARHSPISSRLLRELNSRTYETNLIDSEQMKKSIYFNIILGEVFSSSSSLQFNSILMLNFLLFTFISCLFS